MPENKAKPNSGCPVHDSSTLSSRPKRSVVDYSRNSVRSRLIAMDVPNGDASLASGYRSAQQRARVVTEAWIKRHGYCLACEGDHLTQTKSNTQARDFECDKCGHPYELKSSLNPLGSRIVDGSYAAMMHRIQTSTVPSFLLLQYSLTWNVVSLRAIHHALITSEAIEIRKALAITARRAGWVGCNILLGGIPPEGRIPLIVDGIAVPRDDCRIKFARAEKLAGFSPETRGWAAAVLTRLHCLKNERFALSDAYAFEEELKHLYPENRNIRAKIRQQLQVLRDAGLVAFEARGIYKLIGGG